MTSRGKELTRRRGLFLPRHVKGFVERHKLKLVLRKLPDSETFRPFEQTDRPKDGETGSYESFTSIKN